MVGQGGWWEGGGERERDIQTERQRETERDTDTETETERFRLRRCIVYKCLRLLTIQQEHIPCK